MIWLILTLLLLWMLFSLRYPIIFRPSAVRLRSARNRRGGGGIMVHPPPPRHGAERTVIVIIVIIFVDIFNVPPHRQRVGAAPPHRERGGAAILRPATDAAVDAILDPIPLNRTLYSVDAKVIFLLPFRGGRHPSPTGTPPITVCVIFVIVSTRVSPPPPIIIAIVHPLPPATLEAVDDADVGRARGGVVQTATAAAAGLAQIFPALARLGAPIARRPGVRPSLVERRNVQDLVERRRRHRDGGAGVLGGDVLLERLVNDHADPDPAPSRPAAVARRRRRRRRGGGGDGRGFDLAEAPAHAAPAAARRARRRRGSRRGRGGGGGGAPHARAPLAAVGGSVGGMVRPFHGASLVNYLEFDGALCRQICRAATRPSFVLPPSRSPLVFPRSVFRLGRNCLDEEGGRK